MWFRVDDRLHDHRKTRKSGKAAMGVWVLAGSWCMANQTDGFVPADVLTRWGTPADARRLVAAGLWSAAEQGGEAGWQFHDWHEYQPDLETLRQARAAESDAGRVGNHNRWHRARGIVHPSCELCQQGGSSVTPLSLARP